jgi:hypothetical protein
MPRGVVEDIRFALRPAAGRRAAAASAVGFGDSAVTFADVPPGGVMFEDFVWFECIGIHVFARLLFHCRPATAAALFIYEDGQGAKRMQVFWRRQGSSEGQALPSPRGARAPPAADHFSTAASFYAGAPSNLA